MKMQELYCAGGEHHWNRKSQRGKPPLCCPKHKDLQPAPKKRAPRPKPLVVSQEPLTADPVAPKLGNLSGTQKALASRTEEILDDPKVNDELKRKLRYVQRELDRGRVEGDMNLLIGVRKDLFRQAKREAI